MDCQDAYCNRLEISAINAGIVNVTCIGSSIGNGGCYAGELDASNAGELYVYARDGGGEEGLYATKIYAQNISTTFELTAFGRNKSSIGIRGAEIYVPVDLSKFSLNCYGSGCFRVNFNRYDGFDNISNAHLNINGCLQCEDDGMFSYIFLCFTLIC